MIRDLKMKHKTDLYLLIASLVLLLIGSGSCGLVGHGFIRGDKWILVAMTGVIELLVGLILGIAGLMDLILSWRNSKGKGY
jgi:hypothetical protein